MTAIALDAAEPQEAEGSRLADEIARAMHSRPLMSRLARVETSFGPPAGAAPSEDASTDAGAPPPLPQDDAAPLAPAFTASIEELIDDTTADAAAAAPPTADWLDAARRERSRDRLRNIAAWFTTFAIVGSIVGVAWLMLRV
jgi:hypothetical protein